MARLNADASSRGTCARRKIERQVHFVVVAVEADEILGRVDVRLADQDGVRGRCSSTKRRNRRKTS
jgi:hypothetical protein